MVSPYTAFSSPSSSSSSSSFKRPRIGSEAASLDTLSTIALPILGIPQADDSEELRVRWGTILAKHNEYSLARQLHLLKSNSVHSRSTPKERSTSSNSSSSLSSSFAQLPEELLQTIFSFTDLHALRLANRRWRWIVDYFTINQVVFPLIQSIDYLYQTLNTPDVIETRTQLELIIKLAIKNFRKDSSPLYEDKPHKIIPYLPPLAHPFQLCHCYEVHPTNVWWTKIRKQIRYVFVDGSEQLKYPQLLRHSDELLVKFMLSIAPAALPQVHHLTADFDFLKYLALYSGLYIEDLPLEIQSHADFIEKIAKPAICHFAENLREVPNLELDNELILTTSHNNNLVWECEEREGMDIEELFNYYPPSMYKFINPCANLKLLQFIYEYNFYRCPLSKLLKDSSFISKAINLPECALILEFAESFADNFDFYRTACLNSPAFLRDITNQWLNYSWASRFGSSSVLAKLREDSEILLEVARTDGMRVFQVNPDLITNLKFVVTAAKNQDAFRIAHPSKYYEYRKQAVKAIELQDNISLMIEILEVNGFFITHIQSKWCIHPKIILAAVKTFPEAVNDFIPPKGSEKEKRTARINLHRQAVKINPRAFQFIDKSLRGERVVVEEIVSQCGEMLEFAEEEFRRDPKIVFMATQNNPSAIQFALGEARSHYQILLEVAGTGDFFSYECIQETIPDLPPQQQVTLRHLGAIFNNLF